MARVWIVIALLCCAVLVGCSASPRIVGAEPSTASAPTTIARPTATAVVAEVVAERNHPRGWSHKFPDMTGVIDARLIAHRSGGPYMSPRAAAQTALRQNNCTFGTDSIKQPSPCTEVDVRFFARYGDFWALEGGQSEFVGSWGADREIYIVTVFGRLSIPFTGRDGPGFLAAPSRTYQLDATTGTILMSGGSPLPLGYPGVTTFRAP